MIPGIDVSNNNGTINWQGVAASGKQFAIAKVSQGTGFVDAFISTNWTGMQAAGLARGGYHFGTPGTNPGITGAQAEANHFLASLPALDHGDFLALDLEDDPAGPPLGVTNLSQWVLAWLDYVSAQVGFRPLLYSTTSFLTTHGCAADPLLAQYGLWLASWSRATLPSPCPTWPFVAVWQYGDRGQVSGVHGDCDENYFNGNLIQLGRYGKPAGPIPPPPLPAAPAPRPPVPGDGDYIVRAGDTLSTIATNCNCSLADVLAHNPQITNPDLIFVGQAVHLPAAGVFPQPAPVRTATVHVGDSMSRIAINFGVSLLALERANPQVANPDVIQPGEILNIP